MTRESRVKRVETRVESSVETTPFSQKSEKIHKPSFDDVMMLFE
jgi:hypothetical protein